ncbi:UNVERIFIED_CONTAM: Pentatricopeptide repeat-containing protein, mitochondrial [Sesamum angustifolium]|uniref:Pentatricopeptide repeat-containing protein, mitochondrial n=1 Tax=Sesamum angustifolium TaxID=2727405 RepID=A0AAW2M904_9LAMI
MGLPNTLRNIPKAFEKPSGSSLHSTIFTPSNRIKSYSSPLYHQNLTGFLSSNRRFETRFVHTPHTCCFQRSNPYIVPPNTTTGCGSADNNQNPDAKTKQEAEIICKLVSTIGNSGTLDSALGSVNLSEYLSPSLVLEVLKKLNNAGIMALSFFRWAEKRKKFQHTPECYNVLIESLGKIKQFKMVWLLVDEMNSKDLLCKDTFALVSRRFARAKRVKEAVEAFERMEKKYGLKPELQDYNRLLDTLSKSRHVENAQEPDVVTYGILINAYCKGKRYDEAVGLYSEMERKNIKATPHIYCTLINGLGSEKRLTEAVKFFELCKGSSDCVIEAPTYNALVGAYCWSTRMHDAYRTKEAYCVFQKMSNEAGCEPTVSTYEIMVRMFCSEGRTDMALRVWDQMKARGVLPGMHMFSALINGLCNDRKLDEACKYLQEMLDMGMRPPDCMFKHLKQFLLNEGKEGIIIILSHKIEELRKTPLVG